MWRISFSASGEHRTFSFISINLPFIAFAFVNQPVRIIKPIFSSSIFLFITFHLLHRSSSQWVCPTPLQISSILSQFITGTFFVQRANLFAYNYISCNNPIKQYSIFDWNDDNSLIWVNLLIICYEKWVLYAIAFMGQQLKCNGIPLQLRHERMKAFL